MKDLSIDPQRGSLLSIPLLVAMAAVVVVPHQLLRGENPITAGLGETHPLAMLVGLCGAIVAHEAIHGVTWMVASGLRFSDIRFGVLWKALAPYAHPKVPIRAQAYRIGTAMPGLVLGLLPALVGLVNGNTTLSGWGALLLALASGDQLILLAIRSVPAGALVRDHPTRFGCEVLEARDPGA